MTTMTDKEIAERALQAAIYSIQSAFGQDDGGLASHWWDDSREGAVLAVLEAYAEFEREANLSDFPIGSRVRVRDDAMWDGGPCTFRGMTGTVERHLPGSKAGLPLIVRLDGEHDAIEADLLVRYARRDRDNGWSLREIADMHLECDNACTCLGWYIELAVEQAEPYTPPRGMAS